MLPMRREVTVEGVRVTLVDANHCPGAVQILFQLPDGRRFLHCGDMRYHPSMQQVRALTHATLKEGVWVDTRGKMGRSTPTKREMVCFFALT